MNYVIDTSIVIEKLVSKLIEKKELKGKILVPRAVLAELEHQANEGKEIGFLGLEELQELQKLKQEGKIELEFIGIRPTAVQIKYAKTGGEIDSLIRDIAYDEDATLITADFIQAEAAKAYGVKVKFIEIKKFKEKLEIEKFFDENTMSVHLKEDCFPYAKKGSPGNWKLVQIGDKKLPQKEVQEIAKEIVEKSRIDPKSFVEISRRGSTIVQYKNYRIVIVKTPVSDGWEITAVRPLKQLNINDYKLAEKIFERLKTQARGIIISGETGSGKSTFASSLAEFYVKQSKVTKTIESPRDLVLTDEITQYSKNLASSEEIHDILFLSRPDYVIFDEMRDTPDFSLYTDLRLGGGNVIGVVHASLPIDAIQRFITRVETGMIPSILDTLIFIENGNIAKVQTVKMIVKVPTGMTEADLARPVVEVRDFNTNKLEFEIYSYGEETVVVPVSPYADHVLSPTKQLAIKQIENEFLKYVREVNVELVSDKKVVVYIPKRDKAYIIGKSGKNIEKIENKLGLSIDVEEIEKLKEETTEKQDTGYEISEAKNYVIFRLSPSLSRKKADIYINDVFSFTATIGDKGELRINKKSPFGKNLLESLNLNRKINIKV